LISIDFVTSNRSGRHVAWLELCADLVTAVVLGFVALFSLPLLAIASGKIAPATGWPYQVYYLSLPVFAACGLLFILDRFLNGPQVERPEMRMEP
jgi:TRAP-type C4-dicarboxylate transport system permease small subunit